VEDTKKIELEDCARALRIQVLEMIHRAQTSHIGSNFSVIDMAVSLYDILKPDDIVIWSAGWKAATIYALEVQRGNVKEEAPTMFPAAPYFGLAEREAGVITCGGSMGHGLPVAVGMALARKLSGNTSKVYCIMSDGEMNEGTTWEAAMFAAHHELSNLTVMIDENGWQAMGRTKDVMNQGSLKMKWLAFDWEASDVNGHEHVCLQRALTWPKVFPHRPTALICRTVKGRGVSFLEDKIIWHYRHVDDETFNNAMKELCPERLS